MNQRRLDSRMTFAGLALSAIVGAYPAGDASASITCARDVTANVVVIDQPLMFNRLGAGNPNGMIFALKRDVIDGNGIPLTVSGADPVPTATNFLQLRPDRRPRPLVLRVAAGDCLTVHLENLLMPDPNPNDTPTLAVTGLPFTVPLDEQPKSRWVSFHAAGMQAVGDISDLGSYAGNNSGNALVSPGTSKSYRLFAEREGVYLVTSEGMTIGSDANEGHLSNGLFGQVIVEPKGARIYRGQVHEEELRLATTGFTNDGHPILDYEATYPDQTPWTEEGKARLPVLNMINGLEIVHSEINAVVAGPDPDGTWKSKCPGADCPYPLERVGKRNPTVPNRLEPFRDFSSQFHDETANAQAFPGWYVKDPVFKYVLEGVKDAFMINYGSGGIGSEIIANRLGVGPMHDCLDCAYEEFFLTSFTVGDPAMLVDVPANVGLENCTPDLQNCGAVGPKATYAIGAEDPANIHHSYIGDFTKIHNTHVGKEQHVFHLHNHQWLYDPNDDNSNYLDAQGIGPGSGYTYEINFGGSGNRNKSAGDSIFHCHFYPHFAQGMWYHWRHNDTFESGTVLQASQVDNMSVTAVPARIGLDGVAGSGGYHANRWGLAVTIPAKDNVGCVDNPTAVPPTFCDRVRAYPDGEIPTGTPMPAVVPLPGKAMAVMPGKVTVAQKKVDNVPMAASVAKVVERSKNPGYPFWIAGIEDTVGQRPPTPPLDMANAADVVRAQAANATLFANLKTAQADGWDGGLPRHALEGYAAGGSADAVQNRLDFSKTITMAKPVYYPEHGTDLEQVAMAFHANRTHPSYATKLDGTTVSANFVTNGGGGPVVGAPFHNPCIDDQGKVLTASSPVGTFFSGETSTGMNTRGSSVFTSDNPRIYKGTFLQFDAILNKVGYHFPQQRIVALWQDAAPIILHQKPAEPMVFRFNTFDCMVYHNSNLVPEIYELDDYQVRTPTDIIGQHIHLPKWDLSTTDGAANGWNYEDGTLSPGAVRERIAAINAYNAAVVAAGGTPVATLDGRAILTPLPHPYFSKVANSMGGHFPEEWLGARTTTQRWFADPVVNVEGVDRGLGIIFTHDHYGPSTHQQVGLYATALAEPAGSMWVHNETGKQLGYDPWGNPGRTDTDINSKRFSDGGPTSWQAAILPPGNKSPDGAKKGVVIPVPTGSTVASQTIPPHREFYFEFSDFQHAYEKGVYVGADEKGLPTPIATVVTDPNALGTSAQAPGFENTFRNAINPPARQQIAPVFPDLVAEVPGGVIPGCPFRPCPQAISVQDPGVHVVNYRQEPVGLRVYDPAKTGPDGKPGAQAAGVAGDLAFALSTAQIDKAGNVTPIPRKIPEMNLSESALMPWGANPLNQATAVDNNDPFTPMPRAYAGDVVRIKMQAGGQEEEHNASIHGMKWLQAGAGQGRAPNSGWRNHQASGISEQFTLTMPITGAVSQVKNCGVQKGTGCAPIKDYLYSMDTSMDGWWSGMWGILRGYDAGRADLFPISTSLTKAPNITNRTSFSGVCPTNAPQRSYNVISILANDLLSNPGVTLDFGDGTMHNGGPLNPNGGTLVYNPRDTAIPPFTFLNDAGVSVTVGGHAGPIHDPTAMLYVQLGDLEKVNPALGACKDSSGAPGVTNPGCPVRLKTGQKVEPLVLRANAGDCINVTLYNRLPAVPPDLPTYSTLQGVVKRDRFSPQGSTTFNNNLVRPSGYAGLHPQLVAYDVTSDDGANAGQNIVQTAPPVTAGKAGITKYKWYAGDLSSYPSGTGIALQATPVEFGGSGLIPADKVKQGQKSLVGALVTLPQGSAVTEDANQHTQATVTAGGKTFRDLALVLTKDTSQRYADGFPVEHMNGEGAGLPEDSQENNGMALNYGIEPLWFRFGIAPNAPFGGAGCGTGCYGGVENAHMAYSNDLTGGADPATPVFTVPRGRETRLHLTVPHTTSRGSTLAIHGHVWQSAPYFCPGDSQDGIPGKCSNAHIPGAGTPSGGFLGTDGKPVVGSKAIGVNPVGMYKGGQESLTGYSNWEFFLPSAGGANQVPGDYLFRDMASFGNASGLWGILRVQQQ